MPRRFGDESLAAYARSSEWGKRERGTWHTTELYRAWSLAQRRSTEIVVYCDLTGCPVTIAWPTTELGIRIPPERLVAWLRERNLAWLCFCQDDSDPFFNDGDMPCQIGDDIDGADIGAYCHFTPSRCGFAMNLTRLYRLASLESDYKHLEADEESEDPYKPFLQAFEEEHERSEGESESDASDGEDARGCDENSDEKDASIRGYFEGYGGIRSPDRPQPRATYGTHSFQRLLNHERRLIKAEKRAKLAELHSRPGLFLRVEEVERAGLTFEDIYCGAALDSDSE
ncbi:hypothetical protein BKA70DRAFT_1223129 [Coprinopsis sp. MPI-PUGE-AT-0042]|nr:hypothetical protein BKA70DRAFT_1223129 [Coprinopsis sp. MPI-PUGE-AT-0042]